jgi:hypothetical protein
VYIKLVPPPSVYSAVDTLRAVIRATDTAPAATDARQATVPLVITVVDTNNNAPVFTATKYIGFVAENSDPVRVLTVTATDADHGANSVLTFAIVANGQQTIDGGLPFAVGNVTGEVWSTRPLDREMIDFYTFTVRVTDAGLQPQNSTAVVSINVTDLNDNNPIFGRSAIFSVGLLAIPCLALMVYASHFVASFSAVHPS